MEQVGQPPSRFVMRILADLMALLVLFVLILYSSDKTFFLRQFFERCG